MSSSKSYISCQYVIGAQQCCSGGRLPLCIKDTRSFWRQSFRCTNHFFSRYYRKLQCVDISVCCSCGRRESGNNQRPALLRGPLKSSFHWYCYLMEIFDWNEIVNVRVLVALPIPLSGEFEAQPRAIGTNTVFSLTCTHKYIHSHIYKHTNTHIYLYAHTCKHCYKTITPKILCVLTETQNTLIQLSEKTLNLNLFNIDVWCPHSSMSINKIDNFCSQGRMNINIEAKYTVVWNVCGPFWCIWKL